MFNVGDHFRLLAREGQAAEFGEIDALYTVSRHVGAKYWMSRDDGGRGIGGVPEAQLADTAIWLPT